MPAAYAARGSTAGQLTLDCVELVMALEEEFNLEIPDETAVNLKTLGDTITFINQARKR